jgi:hypothetical protein
VAAIAGIGMKTQLKELARVGLKPVVLMVGETVFLVGLVLGLLRWVGWLGFHGDGEAPSQRQREPWRLSELEGPPRMRSALVIESAKLNGHDPWAYLKDVFERLPTLKDRDLHTLLPHNWRAPDGPAPITAATVPAA